MLLLIAKCATLLLAAGVGNVQMYFFTMPGCPPCRQMEPDVDRLIDNGYPVTKVDLAANPEFAGRFNIMQTPTTVVISGDQIVARRTGPMTYSSLVQMLEQSGHQPVMLVPSNSAESSPAAPQEQWRNTAGASPTSAPNPQVTDSSAGGPEQLAFQATVRLRVDDGDGRSYATGTVVHVHGNEALVVTCGHVFRLSQGRGQITADVGFANGQPTTVPARLVFYDAQQRDIGLVVIQPGIPLQPVRIAPKSLAMQTGDRVFSLGCDHGEAPSIRQSVLKTTTVYSGVSKYDVVGRPVDGRSGGGLFSAGGQLIGVCNAAAVEIDEGIYTGLETIYWQLGQTNLAHLFQQPSGSAALADAHPATPGVGDWSNQPPIPLAEPMPPVTHVVNPVAAADTAFDNDTELIVVVRPKGDPSQSRTITISHPSRQLISMLESQKTGPAARPAVDPRMAGGRLPGERARPPAPPSDETMRAQSPQ